MGWLRQNPFNQPNLKFFGAERPEVTALILTKNSPLTPLFNQGLQKLRELGALDQILSQWMGSDLQDIKSDPLTYVLTAGQVTISKMNVN